MTKSARYLISRSEYYWAPAPAAKPTIAAEDLDLKHPTAKPVELVERSLPNSNKAGDVVCDFFGGSGSTMIGCERRGRKARLMEIDPKYADCIVRRYQEYTGKQGTLAGDGRAFNAVAQGQKKESE